MEAFTLGQAVSSEIAIIQLVTQLGAFGLVAFLVVWFVLKILPGHVASMKELSTSLQSITDGFKKHLVDERDTHERERKSDREAFAVERSKDRTEIAGTIERNTLATRDLTATFRGVCRAQPGQLQPTAQPHGG